MRIKLETDTLKEISLFQQLTRVDVIDCISKDEKIYFIIKEGQYGKAIGKGGSNIKRAEKVFKKKIWIAEYNEDMNTFIKNMVPYIKEIKKQDNKVFLKVESKDRARAIGKNGENIKVMKSFMERLFDLEDFKVL